MHEIRWKTARDYYRGIVVLLLASLVTGCDTMTLSTPPTSTPSASSDSNSISEHLAVSFEQAWKIGQNNSVDVSVTGIDKPMILAVELVPQFSGDAAIQKPATLNGTPVVDHLEEITGYIVLHRIDPSLSNARIIYPAQLFDPALYTSLNLLGWELKVLLISEIDAYPVYGARTIGEKYPIAVEDVQARQTWIESEAQKQTRVGSSTDLYITVPDSTAGVFLYYPLDAVADSVVLTSDLSFNFHERR
jgi:hypothetical protein